MTDVHCVTCADAAVALTVVSVDAAPGLGLCVADDGSRQTVELSLLDEIEPGERVLVHAGVALARLETGR